MKYLKKYYLNFIFLIIGTLFISIGGVLFLTANLGSDALMVLNQGIVNALKIDVGYGIIISNLILLVVIIILDRKTIGIGTFFITILLGLTINLLQSFNLIQTSDHFFINLIIVFAGIIIGGIGIASYIYANLGLSPFEGLIIYIVNRTKWHFWLIKIINDVILFTIGFLLGGVFGIGSVLTVFLFGPIINFYLFLLKKTNLVKQREIEIKG